MASVVCYAVLCHGRVRACNVCIQRVPCYVVVRPGYTLLSRFALLFLPFVAWRTRQVSVMLGTAIRAGVIVRQATSSSHIESHDGRHQQLLGDGGGQF